MRSLYVSLTIFLATSSTRADDPVAVARMILDDATAPDKRTALIRDHTAKSPELIAAMTADIKPGAEEYRRIPWIWRIAIAAGRRNDVTEMRRILDASLPKLGQPLRDWQAVAVGGGLVNGVSLEKQWPLERLNELLKDDRELTKRWHAALALAHVMADDEKVAHGTRYDALRMIALDAWAKCGPRFGGYIKKGAHDELQMGAISGLSDIDRPEVGPLLADNLAHFNAGNRKLAIEALLRTDARKAVLRERLDKGLIDKTWLDDRQRAALTAK